MYITSDAADTAEVREEREGLTLCSRPLRVRPIQRLNKDVLERGYRSRVAPRLT